MKKEEKHSEKKRQLSDELSAFIILGFVTIAIVGSIIVNTLIQYNSFVPTSGQPNTVENTDENELLSMNELTSVENVSSIEELQKLNEKELEEAKKKDEKENKNKSENPNKYYIKVNYKAQVVTIYTKDSNGKYTVPVKAMLCSTGTYTPTGGVYKVPAKIRWCHMIGDVYAQYCTQVVGDILFHSVPYARKGDHSSLFYQKYDQLGSRVSLGCIRLTCADAKWIYDNCKIGTQVEFYASSNPGPLGKPSTRKISNAPANIRGWDPTDPVANNPWREYLANKDNDKDKDKDEQESKPPVNTNTFVNEFVNAPLDEPIVNVPIEEPVINEPIINAPVIGDEENDDDINMVINETSGQ